MKVRAIKNFWLSDKVRAAMVDKKIGEMFDVDESEEPQMIYELLQAGRIEVIDEKFIPQKGTYKVIHSFAYKNEMGMNRQATPGKEVSLPQSEASKLLMSGHIGRLDESEWSPRKLLHANVKTKAPVKMFDEDSPPKSNWIFKGRA